MGYDYEDVAAVLNLSAEALANGSISADESRLLHDCAGDFVELEKARSAHFKRLGTEPMPLPNEPEIGPLCDLLKRGDYQQAVQRAQSIRTDMQAFIGDLKQRFKI